MTTVEALEVLTAMCPRLSESDVARKILQQIWREGYGAGFEDGSVAGGVYRAMEK